MSQHVREHHHAAFHLPVARPRVHRRRHRANRRPVPSVKAAIIQQLIVASGLIAATLLVLLATFIGGM